MGAPVSNPLRACERYHAACRPSNADFGNFALTAAIISSLVAALFAAMVSMITCLMVRFGSDSGFWAFRIGAAVVGFLPFLGCFGFSVPFCFSS